MYSCCLSLLKIRISFTLCYILQHSENISNTMLRISLSPKASFCILNWSWTQSKFLSSLFSFGLPLCFSLDSLTSWWLWTWFYILWFWELWQQTLSFSLEAAPNQKCSLKCQWIFQHQYKATAHGRYLLIDFNYLFFNYSSYVMISETLWWNKMSYVSNHNIFSF